MILIHVLIAAKKWVTMKGRIFAIIVDIMTCIKMVVKFFCSICGEQIPIGYILCDEHRKKYGQKPIPKEDWKNMEWK